MKHEFAGISDDCSPAQAELHGKIAEILRSFHNEINKSKTIFTQAIVTRPVNIYFTIRRPKRPAAPL